MAVTEVLLKATVKKEVQDVLAMEQLCLSLGLYLRVEVSCNFLTL